MLRRRGRDDERGAIVVFVAVCLGLLMVSGAFAVDLGMQRVVRRDLQALVDVVALDMARDLDGRPRSALLAAADQSVSTSDLSQSLARNRDTLGSRPVVRVRWGSWDGRTFDPTVAVPTAVEVTAKASIHYAFASGDGGSVRTAIASASSTGCFRLGSFAASVRSGDSSVLAPLNDLLGLNLTLAGYQALAGVDVRLGQVAADPLIGSPTQLLSGSVRVADLVRAVINVLGSDRPTGYTAAITALQGVLSVAGALPAVSLAQALSISPTDSAALSAPINVLDLVSGTLMVATGQHAIQIPNLNASVPGVGSQFTGNVFVVSAPSLACGRPNSLQARASTAQLAGDMGVTFVNLPSLNINDGALSTLVKGTVQTTKGVGTLHVALGGAQGQLVDPPPMHCGARTASDPTTFTVAVGSGLVDYSLTADLQVTGSLKVGLLTNVDIDVKVRMVLSAQPPPAAVNAANVRMPPNDTTPVQTGQPVQLLTTVTTTVTDASATLAGVPIASPLTELVKTSVVNALTTGTNNFKDKTMVPLAQNIDSQMIGPVARMLGLRVAGADVYGVSAVCAAPALRG